MLLDTPALLVSLDRGIERTGAKSGQGGTARPSPGKLLVGDDGRLGSDEDNQRGG